MKRLTLVLAVVLASATGCGDVAPLGHAGDECTPSSCADGLFCVTTGAPGNVIKGPRCEPTCTTATECADGCCVPLLGLDVNVCSVGCH